MEHCKTCKHWEKPESDYGEVPGTGKCKAVVQYWNATEWDDDYDKRSLKPEYAAKLARIIGEVKPAFAFVENSPALTSRGLGRVLGDLAEMGFDAKWGVFSAADVGARHIRERIWIVAHSVQNGRNEGCLQDDDGTQGAQGKAPKWGDYRLKPDVVQAIGRTLDEGWMAMPDDARAFDDMATVVDRLAATGNGQVPAVAAMAWRILTANVELSGAPLLARPSRT